MGAAQSRQEEDGEDGVRCDSDYLCCRATEGLKRGSYSREGRFQREEIASVVNVPPLHKAVIVDDASRVTQMLATGCVDPEQIDAYGYTALHMAAWLGNERSCAVRHHNPHIRNARSGTEISFAAPRHCLLEERLPHSLLLKDSPSPDLVRFLRLFAMIDRSSSFHL